MPVDPAIAELLPMFTESPPLSAGTPDEARALLHTLMVDMRDPATLREVGAIEDGEVAGVRVRVYRPSDDGPHPTVVYLHGGGFTIGSIETADSVCRQLVDDAGAVVVSVDYRLAPEHPFPAAVEDCWAVVQAVGADIEAYGADAARLAVGGDSAGGNLAAVCALLARDHGAPALAAQLLVYPTTDPLVELPSVAENGTGYLLTKEDMDWFGGNYIGLAFDDPRLADLLDDTRLSPMRATTLAGLAPAVVATAEFDPLRDDGNAYAAALEKAGVPVRHREFAGLIHGFYGLEHVSPAIAEASAWIDGQLRELLH